MRVLHAALLLGPEPGVTRQMAWEQAAAVELRLPWRVTTEERAVGEHETVFRRAWSSVRIRQKFRDWLVKVSDEYDVVLVRHTPHDPFRPRGLREVPCHVASMHHTLEEPELTSGDGPLDGARAWLENFVGGRALAASNVIVGVTPEIVAHERARVRNPPPGVVYPNGALISDDDRVRARHNHRGDRPEFLFVAAHFTPWHGLDLLLESLPRTPEDFVLHVVGRVDPGDARRAALDRRVVLHGSLGADGIERLARNCHLGLGSFGLHRKHMTEACTLKVREYLKYGLPVYSGHRDVFPGDTWFYREGPPLIDEILEHASSVVAHSPEQVVTDAEPFIDKAVLLQRLYQDLGRIVG